MYAIVKLVARQYKDTMKAYSRVVQWEDKESIGSAHASDAEGHVLTMPWYLLYWVQRAYRYSYYKLDITLRTY